MSRNLSSGLLGVLMLLFISATNRWMGFAEGVQFMHAHDMESYQKIAEAAPYLPTERLRYHHAQRLAFHYTVGAMNRATGIPLQLTYRLAWAGLCLALVITLFGALRASGVADAGYLVAAAVFLLNPYSLRYYALVPGMVQDLAFVLGSAIALQALFRQRFAGVTVGILLAALGRQTAVTLLPGLAIWMWAGEGWRDRAPHWRIVRIGVVVATVTVTYVATGAIASAFSLPSENVEQLTGVFSWMASSEFTANGFAEHGLRILIPFAIPAALILGRAGRVGGQLLFRQPEFVACLVVAASVSTQPLLAGPLNTGANASRLSALGLVFAIGALAIAFRQGAPRSPRSWALLAAILILGSFHHLYTVVGPTSPVQFSVLQLGLAAAAGIWAHFAYGR